MSNIYDDDVAAALDMIKEFGQAVTWQSASRQEPELIDPEKPWLGYKDVSSADHPVNIVFLPTDRENMALIRAISGTAIPTGSLIGLMGAYDFKPDNSDTVLRGDEYLNIRYIDTLAPNGLPILYTIGFDV